MRLLFSFIIFLFCQETFSQNSLTQLSWLIGKWQVGDAKDNTFEEWQFNQLIYEGKNYQIKGKDTILKETISIIKVGNNFFYTPTLLYPQKQDAVSFQSILITDSSILFENELHDFPKKIGYELIDLNKIEAFIEGPYNGKPVKIKFELTKIE